MPVMGRANFTTGWQTMKRSAYLKEPYLSAKYRKAKLRQTTKPWKLMLAGKDINVPKSVRKFKAQTDPGMLRSTQ